MYTEIANNDYYELGIVGDLVCLQFKPAFDQILGEERGRGCLGTFNEMNIRSQNSPDLHDGLLFILGIRRKADSQTASFNPDNPQEYAAKLHGALQEYIASKQPFKKGDVYWTFWFTDGALSSHELLWANDSIDNRRLALGIAFKTKEECERCIEETKEFWRSR